MRAIKIDAKLRRVSEVEYTGDYRNIYQHIEAELFDVVRIGDKDDHHIFVDDEGLINGKAETIGAFRFDGENPAYLCGHGLILATGDDGESGACTLSVPDVYNRVAFGHFVHCADGIMFVEWETGRAWHAF